MLPSHITWLVFCRGEEPCEGSPWLRTSRGRAEAETLTHHDQTGHPVDVVKARFETVKTVGYGVEL